MSKFSDINSHPGDHSFPTAPPSYDEAVLKQPAYNPYLACPPTAVAQPVQAAPTVILPQNALQPAVPAVSVVTVGPSSASIVCPYCHKRIRTRITTSVQKSAHLAAILLCVFGCMLCSCIPYCLSSFQDVHHRCPECKTFIGTYKN